MLLGRSGGPIGNAYIKILAPEVDTTGKYYMPIEYYFPFGTGVTINPNSCLVKPFKRIMNEGKPIGKMAFAFYKEGNYYFTLASIASTKRHIIFFPGLMSSKVILTPDGKNLTTGELHNIDHFTLDKNLDYWHVTLHERKSQNIKYPRLKTKMVNDDVFLWFVMAIKNVNMLETAPNKVKYCLTGSSESDIQRRSKIIQDSREGIDFPVTQINSNVTGPHFLNFEFYITDKATNELTLPEELLVLPPPISKIENEGEGFISRSHELHLESCLSLSIRVSRIRGSLENNSAGSIFFHGGGYDYPY